MQSLRSPRDALRHAPATPSGVGAGITPPVINAAHQRAADVNASKAASIPAKPAPRGPSVSVKFILLLSGVQSRDKFAEAATVLATELASTFRCDRVSIGFQDKHSMRVVAMSHHATLDKQQAFLRPIAAAMEEAVLQGTTIAVPEVGPPRICLAHNELLTRHAGSEAATIPLVRNGRAYGALTLERNRKQPFASEELKFLESVATLIGPLLELKRLNQLGWAAAALRKLREARATLSERGQRRLVVAVSAAFALLAAAGFYPIQYKVTAPARLEGLMQRALSSPGDGFLKQVYVRPGDDVVEGQLLVELADEELLLDRRKVQGELKQLDSTLGDALARHDRAQIATTAARIDETKAQLELTESRLAHVHIKAPFDAVIINGDLAQSVGVPLRQGDALLVIAPRKGFRVIVDVDERDIAEMATQQSGQITLSAYPDKVFPLTVTRITPVASTRDGRNFFEAEATLDIADTRLRPGLMGIAKVVVAERALFWVLTHSAWNWLRLAFWSVTG